MTKSSLTVVLTTIDDAERAAVLARTLVEEGLAACVNIVPVRSTYRWKDKIETESESLLVVKSLRSLEQQLFARIAELHPYEVPELVALEPREVGERYLAWANEVCTGKRP